MVALAPVSRVDVVAVVAPRLPPSTMGDDEGGTNTAARLGLIGVLVLIAAGAGIVIVRHRRSG